MSSLGDEFDFLKFNAKDLFDQAKSHPQRFLWGVDPLMTKLGNKVMGTHYDPIFDQMGGVWGGHNISAFGNQDGGVYARAKAAGINTGLDKKISDVAHVIAAFYALGGGGAYGGGGDAGLGGTSSLGGVDVSGAAPALDSGGTGLSGSLPEIGGASAGYPASTAGVDVSGAAPALDTGGTGLGSSTPDLGSTGFNWQQQLSKQLGKGGGNNSSNGNNNAQFMQYWALMNAMEQQKNRQAQQDANSQAQIPTPPAPINA